MDIKEFLTYFDGVKRVGDEYQCKCPSHRDDKASLSVTKKNGTTLLKCHAGCDPIDIIHAVGFDSFAQIDGKIIEEDILPKWKEDLEAEYKYYSAYTNEYLYSKLRYKGKVIRYGRTDGPEFINGKGENKHDIYNVNKMLAAIEEGYPVYYAEGEKDCDNLAKLGYVCVTSGGVSDWNSKYAKYFKGATLTIFADNDKPGLEHAKRVMRDVKEFCWACRIVTPSDIEKGDISDVIEPLTSNEQKREIIRNVTGSIPYEYPSWVTETKRGLSVNAGRLGVVYAQQNHMIRVADFAVKNDVYYVYRDGYYQQISDTSIESDITQYIDSFHRTGQAPSTAKKNAMLAAKHYRFEDLNKDPNIINVKNGLVDIRTGTVTPHTHKKLITVQVDCHYPPKEGEKAPVWDAFLNDLCWDGIDRVDESMKKALLEYLGLILSSAAGWKAKKCCMLYSPNGNSGKTQLINVIGRMLGKNNVASISFKDMSESKWATATAYGKRLIAVGDQGGTNIVDSSVFKQLTGGDEVKAEYKGKDLFKYIYEGCILIGTNTLPTFLDDKGNHIIDRLMILHCRKSITEDEKNPNLADDCFEERNVIFAQCLKALQELLKRNYRFTNCESGTEVTTEYRMLSDTLYSFIKHCCKEGTDERIKCSEFHNEYTEYCRARGQNPIGKMRIPNRMEGLGFPRRKATSEYYIGLSFVGHPVDEKFDT